MGTSSSTADLTVPPAEGVALTYRAEHVPLPSIDREELHAKLIRGDQFKLVMTLPDWAYRAKHITGSIQVGTPEAAVAVLAREDEIVVYSSCTACPASVVACRLLLDHGFRNVRHYAGGVLEWEEAGYPLEGDWVVVHSAPPAPGGRTPSEAVDPEALAKVDAIMAPLWEAQPGSR